MRRAAIALVLMCLLASPSLAGVRPTPAVSDGYLFIGEDTGWRFYKYDATNDDPYTSNLSLSDYFVGSAALCAAELAFVGNDNGYLYALSQSDLRVPLDSYDTGGIVCSSPAISYAAESGYRWIYVVSRGGALLAFRTEL